MAENLALARLSLASTGGLWKHVPELCFTPSLFAGTQCSRLKLWHSLSPCPATLSAVVDPSWEHDTLPFAIPVWGSEPIERTLRDSRPPAVAKLIWNESQYKAASSGAC